MNIIISAVTALFLTVALPSVAQDRLAPTNNVSPASKVCAKVNEIDRLVTSSGEVLFLTSKSKGDSDEFKINVYVNQKDKRFTITKSYAKRNMACIVLSGYDIDFKRYSNDQKDEPSE